MRLRLNIDDNLIARAKELSGVSNTDEVLNLALRSLVERESARRLAAMGGSDPNFTIPPRRRSADLIGD